MTKFNVTVSKGMLKVWNAYFEIDAETQEEAETKALELAKEYPEGKITEKDSEAIYWDECADLDDYNFQVEDTQEDSE